MYQMMGKTFLQINICRNAFTVTYSMAFSLLSPMQREGCPVYVSVFHKPVEHQQW